MPHAAFGAAFQRAKARSVELEAENAKLRAEVESLSESLDDCRGSPSDRG
jgi:hypothetical protein